MRVTTDKGLNAGAIGDVPDWETDESIEEMGLEPYTGVDPASTDWQIANGMVRSDPLTDPYEAARAEKIGDRAHAIVLTQDVEAKKGDEQKKKRVDIPTTHGSRDRTLADERKDEKDIEKLAQKGDKTQPV